VGGLCCDNANYMLAGHLAVQGKNNGEWMIERCGRDEGLTVGRNGG
jgi:hypothetical protein